jgi:hypothetical protein
MNACICVGECARVSSHSAIYMGHEETLLGREKYFCENKASGKI